MSTSPTFLLTFSCFSFIRCQSNPKFGPLAHCTREIPRWNEKIGPCGACGNNFGLIFFLVYLQQLTLIYFHLHELTLICLTLTLLSVKSEWCTLGNAWVAAGRQITELSPNENYPQIIPHSELSSNYLRIAGTQTRANAVVLVLSHEIFIISCFKPLSVAAWWGLNTKVIWHWI